MGGLLSQGNGGVERKRRANTAYGRKNRRPLFDVHSMPTHRIIESWLALRLEIDLAPDNGHGADNLIRLLPVGSNGHVVSQLGHTLLGQESRQQNVRVWQIELPYPLFFELRLNLKTAASLIIEQRCKHGGRIEIWIAEKVDGTIYSYEGNRAHIANHPVVFDRFKAHRCRSSFERELLTVWLLSGNG